MRSTSVKNLIVVSTAVAVALTGACSEPAEIETAEDTAPIETCTPTVESTPRIPICRGRSPSLREATGSSSWAPPKARCSTPPRTPGSWTSRTVPLVARASWLGQGDVQPLFAWRSRHQSQNLSVTALKKVGDGISYGLMLSICHALSDVR